MIEDSKSGTSKKHGDLPVIIQLPPKLWLKHHSVPLKYTSPNVAPV